MKQVELSLEEWQRCTPCFTLKYPACSGIEK